MPVQRIETRLATIDNSVTGYRQITTEKVPTLSLGFLVKVGLRAVKEQLVILPLRHDKHFPLSQLAQFRLTPNTFTASVALHYQHSEHTTPPKR